MSARSNDLCGIVNGLDYDEYRPFKDATDRKTFYADTFRKNKVSTSCLCRRSLTGQGSEGDDARYCVQTDRSEGI